MNKLLNLRLATFALPLSLVIGSLAHAEVSSSMKQHLSFGKATVEQVETPDSIQAMFAEQQAQTLQEYQTSLMSSHATTLADASDLGGDAMGALNLADVILDKVINMGKKVWNIIEAGKPVVNLKLSTASAMPQGVTNWLQLSGWQAPTAKSYRISYANGFGMNVVDFTYTVLYTAGGNLNGKGAYLSRVAVLPTNLSVMWGYNFAAEVDVPSVLNTGTKENPVGGAEIDVKWTVNTVIKSDENTQGYFVKGNGAFQSLNAQQ